MNRVVLRRCATAAWLIDARIVATRSARRGYDWNQRRACPHPPPVQRRRDVQTSLFDETT